MVEETEKLSFSLTPHYYGCYGLDAEINLKVLISFSGVVIKNPSPVTLQVR